MSKIFGRVQARFQFQTLAILSTFRNNVTKLRIIGLVFVNKIESTHCLGLLDVCKMLNTCIHRIIIQAHSKELKFINDY